MLKRAVSIAAAVMDSGPRAVLLARGAIRRGAAQKTREFAAFVSLLSNRRLAAVLEIGTLHGGTLWTWCKLATSDATIVSVDLPGGPFGGGYRDGAADTLAGYGRPGQSVRLVRGDSHSESTKRRVEDALDGRPVDLLFIDGDHTYEGVRRDFEMYAPLVGQAGVIAFHDILPHPDVAQCEVDRYWAEVRARYQCAEFTHPEDVRGHGQWGGIGVILP
jgi:predicted O-methyltransferase YrrM